MKFTPKIEKSITNDWHHEFPTLSVYKPRHLLRRVGPLLIGVCLERDSGAEKYKPCFHVHFLGKEFPVVSLTLCSQLKADSGGPDYVEVRFHEQKFIDAARRLKAQSPLPLDDSDVGLGAIVDAYRLHMETPLGKRQRAILSADVIGLMVLCDQFDGAKHELEQVLQTSNESVFQTFGGRLGFEKKMSAAIENPGVLEKIVQSQIEQLRVKDICNSEIDCEARA
jgi:hypothetical protein